MLCYVCLTLLGQLSLLRLVCSALFVCLCLLSSVCSIWPYLSLLHLFPHTFDSVYDRRVTIRTFWALAKQKKRGGKTTKKITLGVKSEPRSWSWHPCTHPGSVVSDFPSHVVRRDMEQYRLVWVGWLHVGLGGGKWLFMFWVPHVARGAGAFRKNQTKFRKRMQLLRSSCVR